MFLVKHKGFSTNFPSRSEHDKKKKIMLRSKVVFSEEVREAVEDTFGLYDIIHVIDDKSNKTIYYSDKLSYMNAEFNIIVEEAILDKSS